MKYIYLLSLGFILIINGCNDVENPPSPNEEELITTVELTFTNNANSADQHSFKFSDPDGEGGNLPTFNDTIKLKTGVTYNVSISFLDESNAATSVNMTTEIEEEGVDHLICYSTDLSSATFTYADSDANNLPIGLQATFMTSSVENGNITVALKHQPGIKTGSCDVGETDVEVSFVAEIN